MLNAPSQVSADRNPTSICVTTHQFLFPRVAPSVVLALADVGEKALISEHEQYRGPSKYGTTVQDGAKLSQDDECELRPLRWVGRDSAQGIAPRVGRHAARVPGVRDDRLSATRRICEKGANLG